MPAGYQNSPEWHAERRTMIGSSDAPAILGQSPYAGPFDVWRSKVEEPRGDEGKGPAEIESMSWGHRLEDAVAKAWADETGHRIRRSNRIIRHAHHPILGASLDREVIGEPWIIEVKLRRSSKGFGERGTALIPNDIWIQVQHQMMVTGKLFAVVVVLFGGQTLRWYNIERDPEFIGRWELAAVDWWEKYVVTKTAPQVDGSKSSGRYLSDRFRQDAGERIVATPEVELWLGDYAHALRELEETAARVELLKQRIMDFMGKASEMSGPGFTVKWRTSKAARVVAWALVAKAYRAIIETARTTEPMLPTLDVDLDAIESIHTSENKAARPFVADFEEQD